MAITEESRHRLHNRLEQVLGTEDATTLMEHLPPVGWADVATKQDLDHLQTVMELRFQAVEERFEARFEGIDRRFEEMDRRFEGIDERFGQMASKADLADFRTEFHKALRAHSLLMVVIMVTLTGLARAA